jgi:hypothetical protein
MDLGEGVGPGANSKIAGLFGYSDGNTDYLPGLRHAV